MDQRNKLVGKQVSELLKMKCPTCQGYGHLDVDCPVNLTIKKLNLSPDTKDLIKCDFMYSMETTPQIETEKKIEKISKELFPKLMLLRYYESRAKK